MVKNHIMIGNWVEVYDNKSKNVLIGYVLSMNTEEVKIYVPQKARAFRLHQNLVSCRENIELHQQDLKTLIDLALDLRDFDWLSTLVSSLELNYIKEQTL